MIVHLNFKGIENPEFVKKTLTQRKHILQKYFGKDIQFYNQYEKIQKRKF
ncbi:MAG: hypothetical protein GXP45_06210 [bacterium]|nr:hypothetical protein [bacterium]